MQRELLIVTTFKEFDGGRDDQIQRFWLKNLKSQTYQNFKLIVTNFREKYVFDAVADSGVSFEFFQSKNDCLYSLTDMLRNTLTVVSRRKHIILYPSPDHIFETNFFQTIVDNFVPGGGGTSFPHAQHLSIEDQKNNIMYDEYFNCYRSSIFDYDPNKHIPETFYFDGDLLLNKRWQSAFFKNPILGTFPGIGLHLIMLANAERLDNLVFKTRVHKIISHVNPQTNKLDLVNHLSASHRSTEDWDRNGRIINDYCEAMEIPEIFFKGGLFMGRKIAMFSRFRITGSIFERVRYRLFMIWYLVFPARKFFIAERIRALCKKLVSGNAQKTSPGTN